MPEGDKGRSRDEAAKDTGETDEAVRQRIIRGEKKVVQGEQETLTQSDQQYIIKQAQNIKVVQGEPQTLTQSGKAIPARTIEKKAF